jgi:hypothetical protein
MRPSQTLPNLPDCGCSISHIYTSSYVTYDIEEDNTEALMNFSTITPNFQYKRMDNGIFEFVFLNNSRAAADEFFEVIGRFHAAVAAGQLHEKQTAFLIELRQPGMPNVAYMTNRYRSNMTLYQHELPPARVAYVYTSGFVFSMVSALLSLAAKQYDFQQRFFHVSEREEAEAWLLGRDATIPHRPKA